MKRFYSSILTIFLAIAFLAVGLTAASQAQEQDMAAFQRELSEIQQQLQAEKITMEQFQQRSMEAAERHLPGLRQQAEQEKAREIQQTVMPDMTARMSGTEGWPNAQAFSRYGVNISKPAGTYVVSYERDGDTLTIHIWKNFVVRGIVGETTQNFTEAEVLAICRAFEPAFGTTYANGQIWRNDVTKGGRADRSIQDPQRRNTSTTRYSIYLEVKWDRRGQLRIEIKPIQGSITQ